MEYIYDNCTNADIFETHVYLRRGNARLNVNIAGKNEL